MRARSRNRIMMTAALLAVSAFGATTINYHLANSYKFGAAPGGREYFDYITLDLGSRRLYLSHGTEVLVVNADTGKAEGKISGLKQCHGIAVAPDVGRGFINDGAQGKAIIFDLKSLKGWGRQMPTRTPAASSTIRDPSASSLSTATTRTPAQSILPPERMWKRLIWVEDRNSR